MLKVAALTVVLSLVGTPAATAVCLIWCGTPCPTTMSQSVSVTGATDNCATRLVMEPTLREETHRNSASLVAYHTFLEVSSAFTPNLQSERVALVLSRTGPPPGHYAAPTVLRL
jgi:hypothetical protein